MAEAAWSQGGGVPVAGARAGAQAQVEVGPQPVERLVGGSFRRRDKLAHRAAEGPVTARSWSVAGVGPGVFG